MSQRRNPTFGAQSLNRSNYRISITFHGNRKKTNLPQPGDVLRTFTISRTGAMKNDRNPSETKQNNMKNYQISCAGAQNTRKHSRALDESEV
jgi:hypothetical protein